MTAKSFNDLLEETWVPFPKVREIVQRSQALEDEVEKLKSRLLGIAQVMELLRTDPDYCPPGNSLKTIYAIEKAAMEALEDA